MKKEAGHVQSLAMKLVPKLVGGWDPSYRPADVAVYGGDNFGDLSLVSEVNIGDNDDDVTLLRNLDKVYRCLELKIDRANPARGMNCIVCQLSVHGMIVTKV
ncbi:cullin-9-like [Branchiostoma lanceolatum]|uniref:cullin-9-like n=1 Tax=Branchiostoma lanceolatum TaxID=7740 RepID=UPI003453F4CA